MQLRVKFELEASLVRPKGEALIDLDLAAEEGKAIARVSTIKVESGNAVFNLTSRVLEQPLRELLSLELSRALNQVIAELPSQVPVLRKVELMDIQGGNCA
jgi:hypothetical protein